MSEDAKTKDDAVAPSNGDASHDDDAADHEQQDALTPELDVDELPIAIGGP